MTRAERVWCALLVRVLESPPAFRSDACDALWRAVLATEKRAELESIAMMLYSLDGTARHVPGDAGDTLWRRASVRPCEKCGRAPCGVWCTGNRRVN